MKAPCTHYQGQCDHLVCPRDAARQAAEKAEIDGWLAGLPEGAVIELRAGSYPFALPHGMPRTNAKFTVRGKPLDPR